MGTFLGFVTLHGFISLNGLINLFSFSLIIEPIESNKIRFVIKKKKTSNNRFIPNKIKSIDE